jgi:MoxR-like ATPase
MNEDASTFDLPEYIFSRLQPQIHIDFPEASEEKEILRKNLPLAEEEVISLVSEFLQSAHAADEPFTVRDGIHVGRYAMRLMQAKRAPDFERAIRHAVRQVLGEDAVRYVF